MWFGLVCLSFCSFGAASRVILTFDSYSLSSIPKKQRSNAFALDSKKLSLFLGGFDGVWAGASDSQQSWTPSTTSNYRTFGASDFTSGDNTSNIGPNASSAGHDSLFRPPALSQPRFDQGGNVGLGIGGMGQAVTFSQTPQASGVSQQPSNYGIWGSASVDSSSVWSMAFGTNGQGSGGVYNSNNGQPQ